MRQIWGCEGGLDGGLPGGLPLEHTGAEKEVLEEGQDPGDLQIIEPPLLTVQFIGKYEGQDVWPDANVQGAREHTGAVEASTLVAEPQFPPPSKQMFVPFAF